MKVELIEHTDVYGKKLFYIKVSANDAFHLTNIGERTYNAIKALETSENEKQSIFPFDLPGETNDQMEDIQQKRGPRNGRSDK